MKKEKIQKPFILSIFGASGNLAKVKLFPSIFALFQQGYFPKDFKIIGYARSPLTQKDFQKSFSDSILKKMGINKSDKKLKEILKHLDYFQGQYNSEKDFNKYQDFLAEKSDKNFNHLAYFSVPPSVYPSIIENLGKTQKKYRNTKLIIEKPFGEDKKTATDLFHFVAKYFNEHNVFLLDHYLGKTAVQSILNLRHSNRLLNSMIKGKQISNIQITAFEKVGVGKRAGYFDGVGIIKDMIQSHLLQLLALITMSIPISEDGRSLHREKYAILSALKFKKSLENIVTGQYTSYKKEENVPKNSNTETFAALKLLIDRESWYKVPIYIRTGKKLSKKHTYIVIEIKKFDFQGKDEEPNLIAIELHPEEKISIKLINKNNEAEKHINVTTSHSIACEGPSCLPEHSKLLLEVIKGNTIHFLSFPEIITSWRITDQILNLIKRKNFKPEKYSDFSLGPKSQNNLLQKDGFKWHNLD